MEQVVTRYQEPVITRQQLRAARAGLRIRVEDLAAEAMIAPNTIVRFENGNGTMRRSTQATLTRLLAEKGATFTARGVEFAPEIEAEAA